MEVMMLGEGCDDRISDDPKRGGVCNSDVIGQAEEGGGGLENGEVTETSCLWSLLLTLFYTRL